MWSLLESGPTECDWDATVPDSRLPHADSRVGHGRAVCTPRYSSTVRHHTTVEESNYRAAVPTTASSAR